MRNHLYRSVLMFAALAPVGAAAPLARGAEDYRLSSLLPESVQQKTDIYAWGWLEYLQSDNAHYRQYWAADLAVGLTQHLTDRVAFSADVHYWDDNDLQRIFVEQAFVSARLSQDADAIVTVGKFNAGIGVEARNAWDRLAGTSSLLFGAVPQDEIGVMLTTPLGGSDFKLRAFIDNGFEAKSDFSEPPGGGYSLEWQPQPKLKFAWTNWLGGGYSKSAVAYGPGPASFYYGGNSTYYGELYAYGNWVGPRLPHERDGLLYLSDAHVDYRPTEPLTMQAEVVVASDSAGSAGISWWGASALANYEVTEKLRFYGRWSYLADDAGLVTGHRERTHELTAGVGYQLFTGGDVLLEYRHDFSDTQGDLNALSVHLVFSY